VKGRSVALVLALAGAGCAYYNGLYNANRLAREATRAEREGRTGEARSLWSQAAVKAESVASRHRKSKYWDDALLLQGRALARSGSCLPAVAPLGVAADSSTDARLGIEARLIMGECRLQLREPESTLVAVGPVLATGEAADQSRAHLLRGQALLRLGRDAEALEELAASGQREAEFERAMALTRLKRRSEAVATLEGLAGGPYNEVLWLPVLDTVGTGDPASVSALVDRLGDDPARGIGERLRLWLQDGRRWLAAGDSATAGNRFAQVRGLAPDSIEGRTARAHLAVFAAARAESWSQLADLLDSLNGALRLGGEPVRVGGSHLSVLTRASRGVAENGTALGLFLAAEDVRDTLGNRVLSASLFSQVEGLYGESALAPKALLAIAALRPDVSDSLVAVLQERYAESPYALVIAGGGSAAFEALEDSLVHAIQDARRRGDAADAGRARRTRVDR
jgi:predicted negative regulator of RcsB-dependent stress response